MTQKLVTILLLLFLLFAVAFSTLAEGDKTRGDEGQGGVYQHQVEDPPPFEP